MAGYVSISKYKQREIVVVDCANQDVNVMLAAMDEMLQVVMARPRGEKVLVLLDMRNTPTSMAVSTKGREIIDVARRNGIGDMPTAIVGFTGAQKVITQMFASLRSPDTLYVAETIEAAKDWLIVH
jgi:hypothetical protein